MNIDQAFSYIKHSAEIGRMAQAYVVTAPPREAGLEFASRIFPLLFDNEKECSLARNGMHPDVHKIEPEKKSRVISVDQMRAILKKIYETSYNGGWKICIFVGADCMNASSANAFLKTLEEPPAKTLFLLLTDSPQRLLPTIISRCQHITISEGSSDGLDDELRSMVASILSESAAGEGVVRMATAYRLVSLLKDLESEINAEETAIWKEEHIVQADDENESKKEDNALKARISSRYREKRQAVMHSILLWYRDILLLVCGSDQGLVHHRESLDVLLSRASEVSYRDALAQVGVIEEINRQLGMNMPELLIFSNGFK
jgi:DNA polymerase-3 subunit delta'